MRRLALALLLSVVLALGLSVPALAATPATANPPDVLLLAAEGGEGGELPGREPPGPNDPGNPNPPTEYEQNFLWGAAVGLSVAIIALVLLLGGLYYLLVQRPRQKAPTRQ